MAQLLTYPDTTLLQISGYVRHFDDPGLKELVDTMIATAKEHNLKALSAIQIGVARRVIVFEKDGEFIPLINPTIFAHSGEPFLSKESDESLPNATVEVKRFPKIKVMYQDLDGKDCFMELEGEEAVVMQRKIDMIFGGMLFDKLNKKELKKFFKEYGYVDACPTYFIKDRILAALRLLLVLHAIALVVSLFSDITRFVVEHNALLFGIETIWLLFYGAYARYETKKYKNCTSCQNANIIGTVGLYFVPIVLYFLISSLMR